ncbi:Seven_transmembrane protein 1 [Hexamita inflata]|uniref:Seven transmembrane protein 1 n=1 Tax=Hexamita inflata TaxID=28002 RepID=A0AA86Q382_9EUKA|nr:Seven transmembrane protein 1 [Hexamita inflata]
MFAITITANTTQITQYVTFSQDKAYLVQQTPYLLGCILLIFTECTVFAQYIIYTRRNKLLEEAQCQGKMAADTVEIAQEAETVDQTNNEQE